MLFEIFFLKANSYVVTNLITVNYHHLLSRDDLHINLLLFHCIKRRKINEAIYIFFSQRNYIQTFTDIRIIDRKYLFMTISPSLKGETCCSYRFTSSATFLWDAFTPIYVQLKLFSPKG